MTKFHLAALLASVSMAATAVPALAQSASSDSATSGAELEDIVVTAQRRAERLQDVPVAVTAVTASALSAHGIAGTTDLTAVVPGLVFVHTAINGNFYLRGVGTNLFDPSAEQTVAMFVDGVYIPAPTANQFSFNNIDRIEVLKGPQGTLFGRNTTGGVVQIITRDPQNKPSAEINVGFDNYRTLRVSGYATAGLSDTLAADIAVQYEDQNRPYGYNLTTGQKLVAAQGNIAIRSKWKWTPTDSTTIKLSGDFTRNNSTAAYHIPRGVFGRDATPPTFAGSTYAGDYNTLGNLNNREYVRQGGGSLTVEQDLGTVKLLNITAYRETNAVNNIDQDQTPSVIVDLILPTHARSWTEELQAQSATSGPFKWTVGLYYFNQNAGYDNALFDGGHFVTDHQKTESIANFGQATYDITSNTSITGGLRYTVENQSYVDTDNPLLNGSQSFRKMTWRLSLDHHFSRDVLAYVSWNRGSKSGGFNLLSPGDPGYQPETLDAYELGLKSELFDRRLRLNMAGFYYDYKNIQVQVPKAGTTSITNGPKARIFGWEADFEALPTDALSISGGITVLDSKFRSYPRGVVVFADGSSPNCDATPAVCNFAGHRLASSPKVAGNLSVDYRIDTSLGRITPSVSGNYNSGYFFYSDNRLNQPSFFTMNASLSWASSDDRFTAKIWGRNLTDKRYFDARAEQGGLNDADRYAAPRTVGVTLGAKI